MTTLIVVSLLVFATPYLLLAWNRWIHYQTIVNEKLALSRFDVVASEAVPEGLRQGLDDASAELIELGFARAGYMVSRDSVHPAQFSAALYHEAERAFAVVQFAFVGDELGPYFKFTTLFEDGFWITTFNGRLHFLTGASPGGRQLDARVGTTAEHWQHHRKAVREEHTRSPAESSLASLAAFLTALDVNETEVLLAAGRVERRGDAEIPRWTRQAAVARCRDQIESGKQVAASAFRAPPSDYSKLPVEAQEHAFQMETLIRNGIRSGSTRVTLFVLSGLAFAASMLLFSDLTWLAWVVPVLLFHELGHFAAMRVFGHSDASIYFVPFFGAATVSAQRFNKLWHEIVVLLAGPVPGIVVAIVLFQLPTFRWSGYFAAGAITLLTINLFNLLPLYPLDGGKIFHALVTASRPRLDIGLKAAAAVGFGVLAVAMGTPLLLLVGLPGLLALRRDWRLLRIERQVRNSAGFDPALPEPARRQYIFRALADVPIKGAPARFNMVRRLEGLVAHRPPKLGPALVWVAIYGACLVFPGLYVARTIAIGRTMQTCPTEEQAAEVACGDSPAVSEIRWDRLPADAITSNPMKLVQTRSPLPNAALVWCSSSKEEVIDDVHSALRSARVGEPFCATQPWEGGERRTPEQEAAWYTLGMLDAAVAGRSAESRDERLVMIDRAVARLRTLDQEVGRRGVGGAARRLRALVRSQDHVLAVGVVPPLRRRTWRGTDRGLLRQARNPVALTNAWASARETHI